MSAVAEPLHAPGCACAARPEQTFRCDSCDQLVGWCRGAADAVERLLASPDGGICDACAAAWLALGDDRPPTSPLGDDVGDALARHPGTEARRAALVIGVALVVLLVVIALLGCDDAHRECRLYRAYEPVFTQTSGAQCPDSDHHMVVLDGVAICRCGAHAMDGGHR